MPPLHGGTGSPARWGPAEAAHRRAPAPSPGVAPQSRVASGLPRRRGGSLGLQRAPPGVRRGAAGGGLAAAQSARWRRAVLAEPSRCLRFGRLPGRGWCCANRTEEPSAPVKTTKVVPATFHCEGGKREDQGRGREGGTAQLRGERGLSCRRGPFLLRSSHRSFPPFTWLFPTGGPVSPQRPPLQIRGACLVPANQDRCGQGATAPAERKGQPAEAVWTAH